MKRGWTLLAVAVVLSLAIGFAGVYYYRSAWHAARAAAIAIVLGDEIPPIGPPDPSYRLQLGRPARDELTLSTDPGWFELSRRLQFNFTIRNAKNSALPAVQLGVGVELTPQGGWEVIGYGSGG